MARVKADLDPNGLVLEVALSERNLLTLLTKLYTPRANREFICGDVPAGMVCARIRAETDQTHYNSPSRRGAPPGPMHPVTERVLVAIHDALTELQREGVLSLPD